MSHLNYQALFELGGALQQAGYRFTAVTPATHARVLARGLAGEDLADVFGWNRPFAESVLPPPLWALVQKAGIVSKEGDLWRANVRFASLNNDLLLHSGYPTTSPEAVFFGPDTYRFANFLRQHSKPARRAVDLGAGSGAGGLSIRDRVGELWLTDINPMALAFVEVNVRLTEAGKQVRWVRSDVLNDVAGQFDLIVSNPPYLVDDTERAYRHGGELYGAELSVRIVRESLVRLAPGGQLLLYTASAIVRGHDTFWHAVAPLLKGVDVAVEYFEIDPDVFGEELERAAYRDVDRLAVVGLVLEKPAMEAGS